MLSVWLETDVAEAVPAESDFQRWAEATMSYLQQAVTSATLSREQVIPSSAGSDILARLTSDADVDIAIRVVSPAESEAMNTAYRDQTKATNVLSFPADIYDTLPAEVLAELEELPLGDLIICAEVVIREAAEQGKPVAAHWAHMTVHGILHLLGHDHIEMSDAAVMEPLEIAILAILGCDNPYDDDNHPVLAPSTVTSTGNR